MDFKIEDDLQEKEEVTTQDKNKSLLFKIIVVIVVSIIVGFTVFLISNAFFGKKTTKTPVVKSTPLSIKEENVEILYNYVTYGVRGKRNDKFVKEPHVTLQSFTNEERFYYALQFVQVEDFVATNRVDENNLKIYTISTNKINNYMKRFFGGMVTYSSDDTITYPFSFRIGGKNVGVLKAANNGEGFDTVFTELQEDLPKELVEPYYGELVAAEKKPDGSYQLTEKVIYTEVQKENDNYTVYIYRDYQHTDLLEKKTNQTEAMLKENPISITNYKDKATTITYLFKLSGTMLYFDSSNIKVK